MREVEEKGYREREGHLVNPFARATRGLSRPSLELMARLGKSIAKQSEGRAGEKVARSEWLLGYFLLRRATDREIQLAVACVSNGRIEQVTDLQVDLLSVRLFKPPCYSARQLQHTS